MTGEALRFLAPRRSIWAMRMCSYSRDGLVYAADERAISVRCRRALLKAKTASTCLMRVVCDGAFGRGQVRTFGRSAGDV